MMRGFIQALVASALLAGCAPADETDLARDEAVRFHRQFDAGRFKEIYADTGPQVRREMSEAEFVTFLADMQMQLGKVAQTSATGSNVEATGKGKVVTLTYNTQFANGVAEETFAYTVEGGRTTLTNYYIKTR